MSCRRTRAPGELTQRNFPTVSSTNVRTSYSYDSAGRLEYETVTKETGSTTNMYRTNYSYSYLTYGRQVVRLEEQYAVNNWQSSNRVTYKWNTLGWQNYEEREDYNFGSWANRYDISQEYDKVGNRTRFHRNVASGFTSSYGKAMDLSYTYNVRNNLSAISDADDANYAAAVTSDANMNLTVIDESYDNSGNVNHLYTYFDVDDLNRVTSHRTKKYLSLARKWQWTKREHGYSGTGSLVNTTMKQWYDGDSEPAGDSLEHIYDRSRMLQNYDGTSTYGDEWRWAGSQNNHNSPLHSPNSDTAAQTGYNLANDKTPQRRTFLSPTSEGDERHLYGQGKPQAKDSSGSGANWYVGVTSQPQTAQMANMESRLFFEGTVTATDMDRASDTREKGRIGITGSAQAYGGSNGRVTSEAIGRDINPLGRGGGAALVGGMMSIGKLAPRLPGSSGGVNQGNSVNNPCADCGGSPWGDPGKYPHYPGDPAPYPGAKYSYVWAENERHCVTSWYYENEGREVPSDCSRHEYCLRESCCPNRCSLEEYRESVHHAIICYRIDCACAEVNCHRCGNDSPECTPVGKCGCRGKVSIDYPDDPGSGGGGGGGVDNPNCYGSSIQNSLGLAGPSFPGVPDFETVLLDLFVNCGCSDTLLALEKALNEPEFSYAANCCGFLTDNVRVKDSMGWMTFWNCAQPHIGRAFKKHGGNFVPPPLYEF